MPAIAGAAAIAMIVSTAIAGCASAPDSREQTLARIEHQLELDELGEVVCAGWHRPSLITPSSPYIRSVAVTDETNFDEIVARLKDEGFDVQYDFDDKVVLNRADGAEVRVYRYRFGDGDAPLKPGGDVCSIPRAGLVDLEFLF